MQMRKKSTSPHLELVATIYHLIVAVAIFSLVSVLNNSIYANNGNLTIINSEPITTITTKPQISYEDISNKSYKLMTIHIKIWTCKGNLDLLKNSINDDILETTQEAETLVREDIIEILKNTNNKTSYLDNHLQKMDITLNKSDFIIMILDQDISTLTQEMQECLAGKTMSDKEYFDSITYYDQQGMIESLKKSTAYNTCIAQTRLAINAKTAVVSRLKFYNDLLKTKYNFLSNNEANIIKNINILDTNTLQQLNIINNTLNSYNF